MLDAFIGTVVEWISGGVMIAAAGCFLWEMVSVLFSPCHLASIPLIVAYVGGQERAINPRQAGIYAASFTIAYSLPSPWWGSFAPCWDACWGTWGPTGRF